MGSAEKFCLRWNDFESNISVAFRELREDKDFFDVTLACDDNQLPAHKVILSACSPFFRNILRKNPHQHPLLYLKGVKYKELQSVLNFMYMGEVNVAQEELNSFLSVAEELRVKGLTQNNSDNSSSSSKSADTEHKTVNNTSRVRDPPEREHIPPAKKHRPAPAPHVPAAADDDIQEVVPVKSEPRDVAPVPVRSEPDYPGNPDGGTVALQDNYQDDGYNYDGYEEGYDEGAYEQSMQTVTHDGNKGDFLADGGVSGVNWKLETECRMRKGDGGTGWTCQDCSYISKVRMLLVSHIESQHLSGFPGYKCALCGAHSTTYSGLEKHTSRQHSISLAKMKNVNSIG